MIQRKHFSYKVFEGNTLIANWDDISQSDLEYNQEINSTGTEIVVTLGIDPYVADGRADIQLDNIVKIFRIGDDILDAYSNDTMTSVLIFTGRITNIKPDYKEKKVEVTLFSLSADMDKIPFVWDIIEYNNVAVADGFYGSFGGDSYIDLKLYSSFATNKTLQALKFFLNWNTNPAWEDNDLRNLDFHIDGYILPYSAGLEFVPGRQIIDGYTEYGIINIDVSNIAEEFNELPTPSSTVNAKSYRHNFTTPFLIKPFSYYIIRLFADDAPNNFFNVPGFGDENPLNKFFNYYVSDPTVESFYMPPSALASNFLTQLHAAYMQKGGNIRIKDGGNSTITPTTEIVSYTFSRNSFFENVNNILKLSPFGYYWYIDIAKNILWFKKRADTPQHFFSFDESIVSLDIEKKSEDVVNAIFILGGKVSGVSYSKIFYYDSQGKPVKMLKYSDTNITTDSVARTVANNLYEIYGGPEIKGSVTIADREVGDTSSFGYPIDQIKPGDTVGLKNINSTIVYSSWDILNWDADNWDYDLRNIETMVLQVTKIQRKIDSAVLSFSSRPFDITKKLDQAIRQISNVQMATS